MKRIPSLAVAFVLLGSPAFAQGGAPMPEPMKSTTGFQVHGTAMVAPGGYLVGPGIEIYAGKYGLEIGANYFGYSYEEDGYFEDGEGYLLNVRGRWYAQVPEPRKLWVAGGLAMGVIDTYWGEYESGGWTYGSETNPGVVANFGLGYKALLAEERLVLDPQILLGVIVGAEGNPFIAGAGLNIGWRF